MYYLIEKKITCWTRFGMTLLFNWSRWCSTCGTRTTGSSLNPGWFFYHYLLFAFFHRDILIWYEKQLAKTKSPESLEWDLWGALFFVGGLHTSKHCEFWWETFRNYIHHNWLWQYYSAHHSRQSTYHYLRHCWHSIGFGHPQPAEQKVDQILQWTLDSVFIYWRLMREHHFLGIEKMFALPS